MKAAKKNAAFEEEASSEKEDGEVQYLIGDLAREFNVSLRTLRFYEDRGLLFPKREGLTRIYSPRDRARLAIILKGKQLGFTLTEIQAMVSNEENIDHSEANLSLSLEQINEQITYLEKQRKEITQALNELKQHRKKILSHSKINLSEARLKI